MGRGRRDGHAADPHREAPAEGGGVLPEAGTHLEREGRGPAETQHPGDGPVLAPLQFEAQGEPRRQFPGDAEARPAKVPARVPGHFARHGLDHTRERGPGLERRDECEVQGGGSTRREPRAVDAHAPECRADGECSMDGPRAGDARLALGVRPRPEAAYPTAHRCGPTRPSRAGLHLRELGQAERAIARGAQFQPRTGGGRVSEHRIVGQRDEPSGRVRLRRQRGPLERGVGRRRHRGAQRGDGRQPAGETVPHRTSATVARAGRIPGASARTT
jgi:hypothetical protein